MVIRAGQNQTPAPWPVEVVQGDTLSATTRTIKAGPSGSTTEVTVTAALAQVRATRDSDSAVLDTLTTSYSGGQVTWGGDTISLDPGVYYWDLEVTSTEKGLRTILGGPFVVNAGVSVAP